MHAKLYGIELDPSAALLACANLAASGFAERAQIERLQAHRKSRNQADVDAALAALRDGAKAGNNVMPVSIRCALAGVTTGEWSNTLREVFGEYRAPTGVGGQTLAETDRVVELRERVGELAKKLGYSERYFSTLKNRLLEDSE